MKNKIEIKLITTTPEVNWAISTNAQPCNRMANLTVTAERCRTIEGFGGCFNELGWDALSVLGDAEKEELFDRLFSVDGECRFNIGRVPMGASDYALSWYSLNEAAGDYAMEQFDISRDRACLIPYIKAALNRCSNMTLFASPWSPPTWMKEPQVYCGGRLRDDPKNLKAYALYFKKFVDSYALEGVPIAQVHIQNEVVAEAKYPTCLWSGDQLRVFIRDYLGPLFSTTNTASEIWLGTINAPNFKKEVGQEYDDYAGWILADKEAYSYIEGVGYQWAGKNAIQRNVEAYPELRYMQTENECGVGDNSWEHAHYVFGLLRHYLTNGANSYVYWNMVLADGGGESTWGWKQNSMVTIDRQAKVVHYNPEYYVMRHFSGHIQPGATRLKVTGTLAANAICYENSDSQWVVNINNSHAVAKEFVLGIEGENYQMILPANSINSVLIERA